MYVVIYLVTPLLLSSSHHLSSSPVPHDPLFGRAGLLPPRKGYGVGWARHATACFFLSPLLVCVVSRRRSVILISVKFSIVILVNINL